WRMFRQIRRLLEDKTGPLSGSVEMDETYVGGRRHKGPKGRPGKDDKKKKAVVGIVQRGGGVKAMAVESVSGRNLLGMVHEHVLPASTIYTDELPAYDGIATMPRGYVHRRIRHSAKVYVIGDIHTNSVEGFWSLIKGGIGGVYHSVSQKYLQSYLDEYSFRYNRRDQGNLVFKSILEQVSQRAE